MIDLLSLASMVAVGASCGAFVLLVHRPLEALWARLQASDDPFGNAAYGDWPFVPTENFKSNFHDTANTQGGQ